MTDRAMAGAMASIAAILETHAVAILIGWAAILSAAPSYSQPPPRKFVVHAAPRPVPAITFWNGEGKALGIPDFRGRVILLNLWATWCGPCRHEMPSLARLQAAMGGPDFEVIALSIDRAGSKAVEKFFAESGIRHLSLYIDFFGKAAGALKAPGLPTTLLIDRDGREIGRLVGAADWDTPRMLAFLRRHVSGKSHGLAPRPRFSPPGRPAGP